MTERVVRIAMVAGEASGDLLASHLVAAIKAKLPQATFMGIGGPRLQAQGFDDWWPLEKLAVFGYVDALKNYREIAGIRRQLKKRLLADPPDLFIGVDAPDFNLGLEKDLKARGIPTIHYVSPSIWAWRGERIKKIKEAASHVLALFPIEPPLYEKAGIPVTYVGHPLADSIPLQIKRQEVAAALNLPSTAPIFAFLPGSRQSELNYMAETFIETARLLHASLPEARFLVPLATRETRDLFEAALYRLDAVQLPIRMMFGHAQEAMAAAHCVLVASGTATLEAALVKRPMVITYKLSPLAYRLMKGKGYLPYVGLPNILSGRFLVPELLQEDATPKNLAQILFNLYHDRRIATMLEHEFTNLHLQLRQNTAEKAASVVLQYVCKSRHDST